MSINVKTAKQAILVRDDRLIGVGQSQNLSELLTKIADCQRTRVDAIIIEQTDQYLHLIDHNGMHHRYRIKV